MQLLGARHDCDGEMELRRLVDKSMFNCEARDFSRLEAAASYCIKCR